MLYFTGTKHSRLQMRSITIEMTPTPLPGLCNQILAESTNYPSLKSFDYNRRAICVCTTNRDVANNTSTSCMYVWTHHSIDFVRHFVAVVIVAVRPRPPSCLQTLMAAGQPNLECPVEALRYWVA